MTLYVKEMGAKVLHKDVSVRMAGEDLKGITYGNTIGFMSEMLQGFRIRESLNYLYQQNIPSTLLSILEKTNLVT